MIPFPLANAHRLQIGAIDQEPSEDAQRGAQPVILTVTVTNGRGEFVIGLKQEDFVVLADKVRQKIADFSDEDVPASIGLLFDTSGSMGNGRRSDVAKLRIYKDALTQFFECSNRSNEYFLIGFDQRPQLLMDWTSDSNAILDRFRSMQFKGPTAFFDACYVGLEKVMQGKHNKRAILLMSDGGDTGSSYTHDQVRRLLRQSNVAVYSINVLDNNDSLDMPGAEILGELSRISGGRAFYHNEAQGLGVHPTAFISIFARIADELHHRYLIGFIPSTKATKDQWHRIKVSVNADRAPQKMRGLTVITREGYYAASN